MTIAPASRNRLRLLAGIILMLFLASACAKSAPASGGGGSGPTSIRIERTYMPLNASPFLTRLVHAPGFTPLPRARWTAAQQYQAATLRYGRKRSPRGSSCFGVGADGSSYAMA